MTGLRLIGSKQFSRGEYTQEGVEGSFFYFSFLDNCNMGVMFNEVLLEFLLLVLNAINV